jgi:hypothetical protein
VFDGVEITQQHVDAHAIDIEPAAPVHQPAPRSGRVDVAESKQWSKVERTAVVHAEVPVAACMVSAERPRSAQRDRLHAGAAPKCRHHLIDGRWSLGHHAAGDEPSAACNASTAAPA